MANTDTTAPDLGTVGAQPDPNTDAATLLKALSQGPMQQAQANPDFQNWAGLAGFGFGMQGQANPVVNQVIAAQEADRRQKMATFDLMNAVQRQREAKQRSLTDIYATAAKSEDPTTATWGYQGLFKQAEQYGGIAPPLQEGLISRKIKPADFEEVGKLIIRGVSQDLIQRNYPWATPEVTRSMQSRGIEYLAASLGKKTFAQFEKERTEADRASDKLIKESQFPEVAGNSELSLLIQAAHKDLNKGKTYYEGDLKSQKQAREEGLSRLNALKASGAGAIQGQQIHVEPTGGKLYDTRTHQVRSAVTKGEMLASGGAINSINAQEWQRKGYAEFAGNTLMGLKTLIPRLLATQPAENLVKALELKMTGVVAANPDLRQFHDMVFKADTEMARVLGGGSVVRQQMLNLVSKYAGIATTDTVATATRLLDNNLIDMENQRRTILSDPSLPLLPVTGHVRIGPGAYWAVDKRTGAKVPIKLRPGQISEDHYEVFKER